MPDEFRPTAARVASGVLFRDDAGRVLLVKPIYKLGWDLPGGYVEPGESPRQAAVREVSEELGLSCDVGRLLVVDWAPHPDEGDKVLFVFDGGVLPPRATRTARLQESEIDELRFATDDELPEMLPPRLLHRIRSAVAEPADPYLEYGTAATD